MSLIVHNPQNSPFNITVGEKNIKYRLTKYHKWLGNRNWLQPQLEAYRDHLLYEENLAPKTVHELVCEVRRCYERTVRDPSLRNQLLEEAPGESFADKRQYVQELIGRIVSELDKGQVQLVYEQDIEDEKHIRLTLNQGRRLVHQAGQDSPDLLGLRNQALVSVLIGTGLREAEVCGLDIDDLSVHYDGKPALRVKSGKGSKKRLVLYGSFIWVKENVEQWLNVANITDGPVFRGFYKGYKTIRPTRLSTRTVNRVLENYAVDGLSPKPHDLRRTYARWLFNSGMGVEAIASQLGHASTKTTLHYIGSIDAKLRSPSIEW